MPVTEKRDYVPGSSERSVGTNLTGLSVTALKSLRSTPTLYDRDLSHGMNSDVFLLPGGHVVKLARKTRKDNPLQADSIAIAEAMSRVDHPRVEKVVYGYQDQDAGIVITKFQDNLTQLSQHERGVRLLEDDAVLGELVGIMAHLDTKGVLQKDLCEWDILFDASDGRPFILDFDKVRTIDWGGDNIPLEQLALGFERDNSTLRPEVLNIDDLQENFIMEASVFLYEGQLHDQEGAINLFGRFLQHQYDTYCPAMIDHFEEIGREDLAGAMRERQAKLAEWVEDPYSTYTLYMRKRMHFLMRATNWATEVTETSDYNLKGFMEDVLPLLQTEIARREQLAEHGQTPLYVDPAFYKYQTETESLQSERQPETGREIRQVTHLALDLENIDEVQQRFPKKEDTLRIAFFGDLHGKIQRLAKVGQIIEKIRANASLDAVFASGDNVEGGNDVSLLHAVITSLSKIGIDASAIGNHEFDYHDTDYLRGYTADLKKALLRALTIDDKEAPKLARKLTVQEESAANISSVLARAFAEAKFPFISSNLSFAEGSPLAGEWESQHIIPGAVTERGGRYFAVLGATTPSLKAEFSYHRERGFHDDVAIAESDTQAILLHQIREIRKRYKDKPVTAIVLSHCGLPEDLEQLAHPEIDVIIGGHTHNLTHQVVNFENGSTHIVHAGQNGLHLGMADLHFDTEGKIDDVSLSMVDVEKTKGYDVTSELQHIANTKLIDGEIIGQAAEAMTIEGKSTKSTPLMRFVTDAVREQTGTDISLNFAGNVREGISQGLITQRTLHEMIPWQNNLCITQITGDELREALQYAVDVSRIDSGKRPLLLHFSGLTYTIDDAGEIAEISIDRQPIDSGRVYTLSAPDFMFKGGLGQEFPLTGRAFEEHKTTVKELIEKQIRQKQVITASPDDAVVISPVAPLQYNNPSIVY